MQPAHQMSTEELLVAVGESLYGARWRRDMARELGVAPATVDRIVNGGKAGSLVQRRLGMLCCRLLPVETARALRRTELLSTGAMMPLTTTAQED